MGAAFDSLAWAPSQACARGERPGPWEALGGGAWPVWAIGELQSQQIWDSEQPACAWSHLRWSGSQQGMVVGAGELLALPFQTSMVLLYYLLPRLTPTGVGA